MNGSEYEANRNAICRGDAWNRKLASENVSGK
jgi:hypothetical protein